MKIADADKLKYHFEHLVDVKLFTPAQILTIIDTFSKEVPVDDSLKKILNQKPDIVGGGHRYDK